MNETTDRLNKKNIELERMHKLMTDLMKQREYKCYNPTLMERYMTDCPKHMNCD